MIYISFDSTFENLNVKLQTKCLLTEIIDAYDKHIWDTKVWECFIFYQIFFKSEISFKKLKLCENMLKLSSKHYHRVIFISSYFELTHKNRLRD